MIKEEAYLKPEVNLIGREKNRTEKAVLFSFKDAFCAWIPFREVQRISKVELENKDDPFGYDKRITLNKKYVNSHLIWVDKNRNKHIKKYFLYYNWYEGEYDWIFITRFSIKKHNYDGVETFDSFDLLMERISEFHDYNEEVREVKLENLREEKKEMEDFWMTAGVDEEIIRDFEQDPMWAAYNRD